MKNAINFAKGKVIWVLLAGLVICFLQATISYVRDSRQPDVLVALAAEPFQFQVGAAGEARQDEFRIKPEQPPAPGLYEMLNTEYKGDDFRATDEELALLPDGTFVLSVYIANSLGKFESAPLFQSNVSGKYQSEGALVTLAPEVDNSKIFRGDKVYLLVRKDIGLLTLNQQSPSYFRFIPASSVPQLKGPATTPRT